MCFVHFDFEMCFAPQRRAPFWTPQLPKVVRTWCVLYILTWKCASRHNGVHFFDITSSKSLRCVLYILTWTCASRHNGVHHFSSLTWPDGSAPAALASLLVDPAEPQIIGKTQCFATFLPCVILFLLTLSLL